MEDSQYAQLLSAYERVPEFAEQGYDLRLAYDDLAAEGLWCCFAQGGVAFAAAHERRGCFHLWLLGVDPGSRGQGHGAQLVSLFLTEGTRRGFARFTAKTHSGAPGMMRLLEGAGFAREGRGPVEMPARGEAVRRERYDYARS